MTDFSRFEEMIKEVKPLDSKEERSALVIAHLEGKHCLTKHIECDYSVCNDLLSAVEKFAQDYNLIDSEEALSDEFDTFCEELPPHYHEDKPALNADFSNYKDCLLTDNRLHPEQVNQYCYIGKYK